MANLLPRWAWLLVLGAVACGSHQASDAGDLAGSGSDLVGDRSDLAGSDLARGEDLAHGSVDLAGPDLGGCPSGEYQVGTSCVACTASCPAGQYAVTACAGDHDLVCTACGTIAGCASQVTCTGSNDSQCTSCGAGSYVVQGSADACASCAAPCADGTYESSACDGVHDRICAACTDVADCAPGHVSCTGPADSSCDGCDMSYYASSGACAACATCAAGQYTLGLCEGSTDTVCTSCAAIAGCASVTCTSGTNQTCGTCAAGHYANGTTSCSACTPIANCASVTCTTGSNQTCASCAAGYRLSGNACVACGAIVNCSSVTCSSATDQICASCARGYYGNGMNGCAACSCPSATGCLTSKSVCDPTNGTCLPLDADNDGASCACGGTCASGVCVASQLRDGFQRPSLRPEIWSTDTTLPAGSASVGLSSGTLALTNGGFLVTASQFDPSAAAFHFTGDWTFSAPGTDGDRLQILTRSTGTPSSTDGEATGGVECQLDMATATLSVVARGSAFTDFSASAAQSVTAASGDTFFFEMIDDGANITCTVIHNVTGAKTSVTATTSIHPGTNHIVFHDRALTTQAHMATLDHVMIEPLGLRPTFGWRFNPVSGAPTPRAWASATGAVLTGAVGSAITAAEGHDGAAVQGVATVGDNSQITLDIASGDAGPLPLLVSFWYQTPAVGSSWLFRPFVTSKNQRGLTPTSNSWFNYYLVDSPAPTGLFAEMTGPSNMALIQVSKKNLPATDQPGDWHQYSIYRCVDCSGGAIPNSCLSTYRDGQLFSGPICVSNQIANLDTEVNTAITPNIPAEVWVGSSWPASEGGPSYDSFNPGQFEDVRFYHADLTPAQIFDLAACE